MPELIAPVRGMNDILAADAPFWECVETEAMRLFRSYGYDEVRLPVLERTELFKRSIGELTDIVDKEMYTFTDRNGDSLTLRPEATASMVRACLSNGLLHNQQQKFWCRGPMFRREKPQKGRYRQFHQLSVEALGFSEPEADAELIVMSWRLWQALGLENVTLELNSLGVPESRARYRQVLVEYFNDHKDDLDADSLRRLERNPLRILDSKNPTMAEILAGAPLFRDHLDVESREHFERVQTLLADAGVDYVINPHLVRGLDYYTRTVFEWTTDQLGAQGAICSGGRYDGLVAQLGGRDTPAVGWALGIERIVELMRASRSRVPETRADFYVACVGAEARRSGFAAAERLRSALPDRRVVFGLSEAGLKAQLRRADKSGAEFAIIIGDEELALARVSVKALRTNDEQERMSLDDFIAQVLRSRADRQ